MNSQNLIKLRFKSKSTSIRNQKWKAQLWKKRKMMMIAIIIPFGNE